MCITSYLIDKTHTCPVFHMGSELPYSLYLEIEMVVVPTLNLLELVRTDPISTYTFTINTLPHVKSHKLPDANSIKPNQYVSNL